MSTIEIEPLTSSYVSKVPSYVYPIEPQLKSIPLSFSVATNAQN